MRPVWVGGSPCAGRGLGCQGCSRPATHRIEAPGAAFLLCNVCAGFSQDTRVSCIVSR